MVVYMKVIGLLIKWKDLYVKKGKFIWKNGCIYIGNFKNNKRNGKGELIYSNNFSNLIKYEGFFRDD